MLADLIAKETLALGSPFNYNYNLDRMFPQLFFSQVTFNKFAFAAVV